MFRSPILRGTGLFRRGRGKAPWELILELAKEDGWTALYDVGNPNTRTLIEEGGDQRVTRIRDSLENFPDLYGGSDSTSAQVYSPDEFGELEAFQQLSLDFRTLNANVSPNLALPYLSLALFRNTSTASSERNITDGSTSNRFTTGISQFAPDGYAIGGGASGSLFAFPEMGKNTDTHVMSFLFNGANSRIWMDGVLGAEGSIPSNSNQPLSRIVWGSSDTRNSRFWSGYLGLLLIYGGNPSDAVRQRMENLIMELSQVKTYEIPEALDLNGLGLWLDGSDETSLFDDPNGGNNVSADGQVARWEDKSNNFRHARQATSAARPIRKAGAQNGRDVVRFDGTNDFMDLSSGLDLLRNLGGYEVFAVANYNGAAAEARRLIHVSIGNEEGLNRFTILNRPPTESLGVFIRRLDGDSNAIIDINPMTGAYQLLATAIDHQNTNAYAWQDGVLTGSNESLLTSGNTSDTSSLLIRLAAWEGVGPDQFWHGDICELLIYRRVLTVAEREQVEQYLQAKWGTPALP